MEIKQFVWEVVDSNSWLLIEGSSGLLIDVVDSEELYKAIEELDTVSIILTHAHFDHIVGLNRIRLEKPDLSVIASRNCSQNIGNIFRNMSSSATAYMTFYNESELEIEPFVCNPADIVFEDEYEFDWGGYEVRLIAVYGHSNDGILTVIDDKLFSGDTLLNIPTITRFPSGSGERFWGHDIPVIRKLNVEMVYPGHGNPGRIETMIAVNKMPEKYRIME